MNLGIRSDIILSPHLSLSLSFQPVFGFLANDPLTFSESEDKKVINIGFIKGAFTDFYYYQMNVMAINGTAGELWSMLHHQSTTIMIFRAIGIISISYNTAVELQKRDRALKQTRMLCVLTCANCISNYVLAAFPTN